jgi:PE family
MAFLLAAPDALATAASSAADIGSTLKSAVNAAEAKTSNLASAAADEVSTQIAALFSANGQQFQQLSAEATAFHDKFVQNLLASANTYAAAEANVAQTLSGSGAGAPPALGSLFGGGAAVKALTAPTGGSAPLAAASGALAAVQTNAAALSAAVYYPYGYG